MPALVMPHRPNLVEDVETVDETTWKVIASDGTTYSSLALLAAGGKVPWPGIFAGKTGTVLSLHLRTTAFAGGSAFLYTYNRSDDFAGLANDAARDADSTSVVAATDPPAEEGPIYNVWRRKTVATDELELKLRG